MGRRALDLHGRKFGRLTIIREATLTEHVQFSTNKRIWVCGCECGNTVMVPSHHLASGHTRSCGCATRDALQASATERQVAKWRHSLKQIPLYLLIDELKRRGTAE
jgi:hypothetical protein